MLSQLGLCQDIDRECYSLLYNIENYLRGTVRWELRGIAGHQWLGHVDGETAKIARRRAKQEQALVFINPVQGGLLSYLHLSELKDVILDAVWDKSLRDRWPPKELVQGEFRKLIAVRNKSAHFREVTERDLRVVRRFAEDLTDWTRYNYRTKTYAQWARQGTPLFEDCLREQLGEYYEEVVGAINARKLSESFSATRLENHVGFELKLQGHSADTPVYDLLKQHEPDITYLRVGETSGQLVAYVSDKITPTRRAALLLSLLALQDNVNSNGEETNIQYPDFEGLLRWNHEPPFHFEV
jgi:hypothetical protein